MQTNRPESLCICPCPAKINLFLAVTGRRADGFHDLLSVVVRTAFGDTLELEPQADASVGDVLTCTGACEGIPTDGTNLVLRAAALFRRSFPDTPPVHFILHKRVPHGAGLGGGSSNAAAALRLLDQFTGGVPPPRLRALAAALGSDVPLFLAPGPVIMRGRGERLEPLPESAAAVLRGHTVILSGPPVGMETARAYGLLAASEAYLPGDDAEARLARWLAEPAAWPALLYNSFEAVVGRRLPTITVVLRELRAAGIPALMTGSGSVCCAFPPTPPAAEQANALFENAWGPHRWTTQTTLT
ncbi:MAG: 4-(cytidine 5'-diphospho)-2-C-methyl-D-erythritol kinase [Opitutales bacterium]|nr:4-(cytidine 5'-diphospho)-2-C-methyl-D-erythritol kinase [Opitutales bacterium]